MADSRAVPRPCLQTSSHATTKVAKGSNGDQGGRGGAKTYSSSLGSTHTSVAVGSSNLRGSVGGQGAPQNPIAALGGLDDPDPFAADPPRR
ncbi:hypothetical protein L198_06147 [Cryptococcus wingfieldii CBS 7118]|uniref:Uncharacterized protein n=1 Tax=Cryptococcus wingfieldii CBS 7118 TaxID=1295528 RepID=A0A1E3IQE5_9TREE|nr:hypothetical protein L198_06147 [Cryptococcus wingfieldii CBS 7118]ODN90830.1 hypothetical protein L198_06147 [Cryptococcus wingfieldii CBS 7118]